MRLTCEICGEEFEAAHSRSWGAHCETCAGWLRALTEGPFQEGRPNREKLGMTIAYLVKKGKLRENDFIHGLVKGVSKT